MINIKQSIIQVSRSKFIESDRATAVLRLDSKNFKKGEVAMLNYYKDRDFTTNIGVLMAIGIKDGIGRSCYRILSVGGTIVVNGVTDVIPDISLLVHGELYVYKTPEDIWTYVYKKAEESDRTVEPIVGGPYIFVNLEDGYRWFYQNQSCSREDDFFSKDSLRDIIQTVSNADVVFSVTSDNYLYKTGTINDVTMNIKVLKDTDIDVTDKCRFFIDGEQYGYVRAVCGNFYVGNTLCDYDSNHNLTIKDQMYDRNIVIVAEYNIIDDIWISYKKTVNIRFGYTFYYGRVKEGWLPTISSIQALENPVLNYKRNFEWKDIVMNEDKLVLSYPKSYGYLTHIFDVNGLDYIHTYQIYDKDFIINDVPYVVYIKKDVVSVSEFKQIFVFDSIDSFGLDEDSLVELAHAWVTKNSSIGGLVTLDENGKIPANLYSLDVSSVVKTIKGFVTSNPTIGMTIGDIYYNTTTRTLYIAIDTKSGTITNVNPKDIYYYNNEFYAWDGATLSPLRGESSVITSVTELFN